MRTTKRPGVTRGELRKTRIGLEYVETLDEAGDATDWTQCISAELRTVWPTLSHEQHWPVGAPA